MASRVIAAKMIVAPNANTAVHQIKNVMYLGSPGVTVSISAVPGDFNPAQTACVKHNAINNDAAMIYVRAGGTQNNSICRVEPGGIYYVNLKYENPAQRGQMTIEWY
jgi:hypothetical protein